MEDLTIASFAYLRLPLLVAAAAFLLGRDCGTLLRGPDVALLATAVMAIVFFQAARIAMADFDPYLSSRPLAEVLKRDPPGTLIIDHHYYTFSSIFFYTNRTALLLNGRFNNLVYGAYAPGAPNVFIDDSQWKEMWLKPERCYLVITEKAASRLSNLVEADRLVVAARSGGKLLLTNQPLINANQNYHQFVPNNTLVFVYIDLTVSFGTLLRDIYWSAFPFLPDRLGTYAPRPRGLPRNCGNSIYLLFDGVVQLVAVFRPAGD